MRYYCWLLVLALSFGSKAQTVFRWPEGKQCAISLSFDDARESQVLYGTDVLNAFQVKATFYVVPAAVKKQLTGWQKAAQEGHEIGNHSVYHPCSGNFSWSREHALENYTLRQMRQELTDCTLQIDSLLHTSCRVFAYPCGQTYIGKGTATKSYVPIVSRLFISGRGWLDEAPNDPVYCDMSQLTGIELDGKSFEQIRPLIEEARQKGLWIIFAGHEMNTSGPQTTQLETLKALLAYAKDPQNGIWIEPVGVVSQYVAQRRLP